MIDHSRIRIGGKPLAAVLLASLALVSVPQKAAPPPQIPRPRTTASASSAWKRRERARWPHPVRPARPVPRLRSDMLYTQGIAQRQNPHPTWVDEAVAASTAQGCAAGRGPDLLAARASCCWPANRSDDGIKPCTRPSLLARPCARSTCWRRPTANGRRRPKWRPCARRPCRMKSDESRYAVLDDCIKYSGAATAEAGCAGPPPRRRLLQSTQADSRPARRAREVATYAAAAFCLSAAENS